MESHGGASTKMSTNKSINLTGNSRVLKRWAAFRPAGYFTVGIQPLLDYSVISDTIQYMKQLNDLLEQLKSNPENIRFVDLCKICEHYFGPPRQSGSSHRIYKTPC